MTEEEYWESFRMFQFLIGRLGTGALTASTSRCSMFQFLIGRLGTRPGAVGVRKKTGFNSS